MRTLAVDALRLVGPRTAMGRYIEHLAYHWSRLRGPFDRVVLMCPGDVRVDVPGHDTEVVLRPFAEGWPLLLWEQLALPRAARGASVLFCPSYVGPLAYGGPMVVANHGIYEALPGEFSWSQRLRSTPLFRRSARKASRVIANSKATKADLVTHFGVDEARIDVVYPAAHERFREPQDPALVERAVVAALGRRAPYVLFVGKLARRRNVPSLIEAFGRARREGRLPHHLLIVGPNVTGLRVDEIAARSGADGFVTHVPHLGQEELARLYAGADIFVLPTTYEGLSWTILEAMASGTAVLAVPHPTLAEVGGEAAYTVPTPGAEDLARGLLVLLTEPDLRRRHAERGRAVAARHSWRGSAEETLAILDRVARPADRSSR